MYRIVIADDERFIREGLRQIEWESQNMEIVAEAKNGIETMEIIDSQPFDILLTDIRMPGKTGVELAKHLQQMNPKARTIILSGYGEFEYAKQAIVSGVFEYILKPSTPEEILEATKRACLEIEKERDKQEKVDEISKELDEYKKVLGAEPISEKEKKTDIERILIYIYQHYMDEITLAVLAKHFHFNTIYLSSYIKRNTGRTFLEILTSIRMLKAAELLKNTTLKNAEVGHKVGIPDERYFGQVFKRTYKITPYEYKKTKGILSVPVETWLENLEKLAREID